MCEIYAGAICFEIGSKEVDGCTLNNASMFVYNFRMLGTFESQVFSNHL